jgi:hypothetical protein
VDADNELEHWACGDKLLLGKAYSYTLHKVRCNLFYKENVEKTLLCGVQWKRDTKWQRDTRNDSRVPHTLLNSTVFKLGCLASPPRRHQRRSLVALKRTSLMDPVSCHLHHNIIRPCGSVPSIPEFCYSIMLCRSSPNEVEICGDRSYIQADTWGFGRSYSFWHYSQEPFVHPDTLRRE